MLTSNQIQEFQSNGYLILKNFTSHAQCLSIIQIAQDALINETQPIEYEADTRYPGAPISLDAEGGKTARRLLQAYARSPIISTWAKQEKLKQCLQQLLGEEFLLSQSHHNCIMTKQARFSSLTGWHRDSRYWSFQKPELVTVWLALKDEFIENGSLLVIPTSHKLEVEAIQLDEAQFLRAELPKNQKLIEQAKTVQLEQGDVLLFSSNLFHAAGCNQTADAKLSLVMTYRAKNNYPIPGSKSTRFPEISM